MADFATTDERLREIALFSGAGGGILGGALLDWECICAVEREPFPVAVLAARQNEGVLPPFPIWDDVRTFDGRAWRGRCDVVSGGFPCQDISKAGGGDGLDGERSGLWSEFARVIREVRPTFVLVENSPVLTSRGLDRVLGDMASLGYDAEWGVFAAEDAGAPHLRERIWILGTDPVGPMADPDVLRRLYRKAQVIAGEARVYALSEPTHRADHVLGRGPWGRKPGVPRMADGLARRLDRIKATGNGQVPAVVVLAWRELLRRTIERTTPNR